MIDWEETGDVDRYKKTNVGPACSAISFARLVAELSEVSPDRRQVHRHTRKYSKRRKKEKDEQVAREHIQER